MPSGASTTNKTNRTPTTKTFNSLEIPNHFKLINADYSGDNGMFTWGNILFTYFEEECIKISIKKKSEIIQKK